MARPPLELLQGTLDLLILKTLSWGPAHGYAIARWVEQLTGAVLQIGEGSLYPALHRLEEREWVMGVNVMGVVHGVRSFIPRMLKQGDACHVVNTASAAGLTTVPGNSVYCVSKHGVVAMSECLKHELRREGASIGVSVLCPAFVKTGIFDSARNRPAELARDNPLGAPYAKMGRKAIESGKLTAADIANITMEAVKADRFYVIPHAKVKGLVEVRMQDILGEREPTDVFPAVTA